jgi:hypothetical protein
MRQALLIASVCEFGGSVLLVRLGRPARRPRHFGWTCGLGETSYGCTSPVPAARQPKRKSSHGPRSPHLAPSQPPSSLHLNPPTAPDFIRPYFGSSAGLVRSVRIHP